MNFATVDPGAATGLAVWSDTITDGPHPPCWTLLHVGTLKYVGARDYLDRLEATIRNYRLEFAVVERYVNFGRQFVNAERMITQQTLLCEAFRDVVLIGKRTWDPASTSPDMQKQIIGERQQLAGARDVAAGACTTRSSSTPNAAQLAALGSAI